ncbi:MAG: hypothetical protein HYR85_08745, partial [Planctomycetes bacterium]|nr:hypothetical protein [Planctomycetota bacterium]
TQRRQVVAPKADVDFALAAADEAEKGKAHVVVRAVDDATGAPITSFEASFANESGAQELRPDRYGWLVEYPLEKPGIAEIDLTAARWVVLIQPTGYFQWTVKHFEIQRIDRTYAITARLKSLQPEGELGSLRVTVVDSTGLHVPAGFVGARWESPHDGGLRRVGEAVREGSIGGPATRSIVERLAGPDIKWTHSDDVTVDERAPDESTRAPFSSSSVATTLPLRDYSEGGEKLVKRIVGGGAKFDGLKIGRYAVNVVPLGDPYMVLLQASAWIRPAQRTDLYLIVEIGGKLLARLKDTEGHPISAEYMILRNNDVRSAPSYPEPLNDTDWVYPALPAGNYSMEVRCWGFEGRTEAVELRAHETTVLEATLSRSR